MTIDNGKRPQFIFFEEVTPWPSKELLDELWKEHSKHEGFSPMFIVTGTTKY
jgi:hypothetical protein